MATLQQPGLPPMARPLREAVDRVLGPGALPARAHPGLVWDRYPRVWLPDRTPADSRRRKKWLDAFVTGFAGAGRAEKEELEARLARLQALSSASREFSCTGPLLLGAGADHPTETGFSFDPVLGVPVLPGSSVKGLARAGADLLDAPVEQRDRILGTEHPGRAEGGPDKKAPDKEVSSPGVVCFLDAWPSAWPTLRVDILNPHHPMYYQDQARSLPGRRRRVADYTEEPKPVPFLAVEAGTRYRFHLRLRPGGRPQDLDLAWQWLQAGLEHLGIGAKTAAGYGHMTPVA